MLKFNCTSYRLSTIVTICVHLLFQMYIQTMAGADEALPVAHTCFNLLDLPMYSSEEILKHKLKLAIQYYEGFGLI